MSSFLNQLKSQATAVQAEKAVAHTQAQKEAEGRLLKTEAACRMTWNYLSDMVSQLNILTPDGPKFSVDGKSLWPAMMLTDFRADSRKKTLQDREVFSSIGIGWEIVPKAGKPPLERLSVNFLPELQKIEALLTGCHIKYDRFQVRHPEKQSIQAITFEYRTVAHGSITVTPDHETATLTFRFCNVSGLTTETASWTADKVQMPLMDELAKLVVAQPSRLFSLRD